MVFSSLYILRPRDVIPTSHFASSSLASMITIFSGVLLLVSWALFTVQKSSLMFYVYITFPCYFWQQSLVQLIPLFAFTVHNKNLKGHYLRGLFTGGMVIAALLGMVVCRSSSRSSRSGRPLLINCFQAAYTHRSVWSLGFVLIGSCWPLTWHRNLLVKNRRRVMVWALSCLLTAIFPLLSVNKNESLLAMLVYV